MEIDQGAEGVTILIGEKLTASPDRFDRVTCPCNTVHEVRISDIVFDEPADPYGPRIHPGVCKIDCHCGLVIELVCFGEKGSKWEVKG